MTGQNTSPSNNSILPKTFASSASRTTSLLKPATLDTPTGSRPINLFTTSGTPSPQSGQVPAGVKLDNEKPNLDLVLGSFARALWEVGDVGTHGTTKYTADGWVSVPNGIERYGSALLRHYLRHRRGELVDRESGRSHLAHLAWNALALLDLSLREKENHESPST